MLATSFMMTPQCDSNGNLVAIVHSNQKAVAAQIGLLVDLLLILPYGLSFCDLCHVIRGQ